MIEIRNLIKSKIPAKTLVRIGKAVLKKEKRASGDVSIVFLGEKRMRELNRVYRGKNEVTNVLSFDYGPPPFGRRGSLASLSRERSGPLWGGEIALCTSVIRKDAEKYGITFKAELYRIFIHGLLHLVGYDHGKDADFKKMSRKEQQYLLLVS